VLSPRSLLHFLRMLVVCVGLGMVAAPASRSETTIDAMAWITRGAAGERLGARRPAWAIRRAKGRRSVAVAVGPRRAPLARERPSRPAGARVIVAIPRIYLRHASLLC
jgi:hypothetical protein